MISMTGYASHRLSVHENTYLLNLKSWNNRYLEISIQLPNSCLSLERGIRNLLEQHIHRGKIEFSLKTDTASSSSSLNINEDLIRSVAATLRRMAKAAGIREKIRLSHLLAVEGLLQFDRSVDADALWQNLEPGLIECINKFQQDRKREGDATAADIESKLAVLESAMEAIQLLAPTADAGIQSTLRKKFEEVLGSQLDENRILTEIAVYLAKYTINEELVRLKAHLQSFRKTMHEPASGKKLDFICQEFNREANTIGSKTSTPEISGHVILMKEAIENIREQIRNIE